MSAITRRRMWSRAGRAGRRAVPQPRARAALVLALLMTGVAGGSAAAQSAATATSVSVSGATILVNAAAGATNSVTIASASGTWTISDTAGVSAGAGCTAASATQATCRKIGTTAIASLKVTLGDLNDTYSATSPTKASIDGGPGDDAISAGTGADTVIGNAGNDTLAGGAGNDTFDEGATASGADRIDGGAGTDTVSYAARALAVTVDADGVADDGAAGEGDDVQPSVEALTGGKGADALTGGTSADTLTGNAGNDNLTGGPGADRFVGGAGNDTIDARDGEVDASFACGENTGDTDTVFADAQPADPVTASPTNCEVVNVAAPPPPAAQCADGVDNDLDGKVDFPADPGCADAADNNETDPPPPAQCADGVDNDLDGKVDFPADPGCADATDNDETDPPPAAQCADGVDNDGDGKVDFPADPGCTDAADDSESPDPAPPPPPTPNPNPLPPPATGALWGAYVASNTGRTEASTEALIGRKLAIFKRYRHWDHNPLIPAGYKTLAGQGRTLLLTIDAEADTAVVPWSAIASGAQDATIDRFAAEFRTFASPLFVVFHHEPENDPLNGTDSEFAAAFRHFFERLEQQGVTNVSSVWNMMGAKSHFARYQTLYPGDDVVDWVAWDEYNWAGCNARTATWLRPVDTFDAVPWWNAQTWHGYKPQMEAEYGSHESSALGDKGQWFRDVAAAAAGPLADVKAWVYYDSNQTSLNGCAWHVDSSASSLSGFTDAGLSPVMNP